MRRSLLRRTGRLKTTKSLKRKARLKSRGKHGTRYPKSIDRAYRKWIRRFPCLTCLRSPVDPAHVDPWGSSALDHGNIVPLCRTHHREQEGHNVEFEAAHDQNLTLAALALWDLYTARERQAGKPTL